jgi:hypothetical protein
LQRRYMPIWPRSPCRLFNTCDGVLHTVSAERTCVCMLCDWTIMAGRCVFVRAATRYKGDSDHPGLCHGTCKWACARLFFPTAIHDSMLVRVQASERASGHEQRLLDLFREVSVVWRVDERWAECLQRHLRTPQGRPPRPTGLRAAESFCAGGQPATTRGARRRVGVYRHAARKLWA